MAFANRLQTMEEIVIDAYVVRVSPESKPEPVFVCLGRMCLDDLV